MNKMDMKFQQKQYNILRQEGKMPMEAAVELGFSEHIADSVARRLENSYDKQRKEFDAKIAKGMTDLAAAPAHKYEDPMDFLTDIMNDDDAPTDLRMKVALALMPFKHSKKSTQKPLGKKEMQNEEAKEVQKGTFKTSQPPKLKAVE